MSKKLTFCLLSAVFLVFILELTAGIPQLKLERPRGSKIVGGQDVAVGSIPYQISLQYRGGHICGGAIINSTLVITSAHCASKGNNISDLSIRAGVHNILKPEAISQVVPVSRRILHENYDDWTYYNDIALLQLSAPLQLGANFNTGVIAPAPSNYPLTPGKMAVMSGWGDTEATIGRGSLNPTLNAVQLPIVADSVCRGAYGSDNIPASVVCAGFPLGEKDACQGDDGGPLVADGYLVGIFSWNYECAIPRFPGVYTRIPYFSDWLQKNAV